jgi:NitT/TauT family transport system substrate-binding protein
MRLLDRLATRRHHDTKISKPRVSLTLKRLLSALVSASLLALSATGCKSPAPKAARPAFTVGWSVYAGWNPYFYMGKSGILKKWADKYDVDIKLQRFDYAASLDSFVAKNIDACTMTNMEALDMPAASGVETTALIVGDYSNGNDQVIVRGPLEFKTLPSQKVMLVQKTVSEYLLERGMVMNGQADHLKQLQLINTSDSDIAPAFINNKSNQAVVTWKPLVSQILTADKSAHAIFDSSKIPGEILDLLAVRSETLKTPEGQRFAKAITGAWYEAMSNFAATGEKHDQALKVSADASGDTLDSYKEQLSTTKLFMTPAEALAFDQAPDLKTKMDLVRKFCFEHGLLGKGAASADDVGISFPDGSVLGKAGNVKLHFVPDYMQAAADGKL